MKKRNFFQEIISNCSDTYDEIIYESLKNAEVFGEHKEYKIDILSNKESKRISFTDAGIEMTRVQFISNLVKIIKPGT
jgi:HSP90 family molecular chaperone